MPERPRPTDRRTESAHDERAVSEVLGYAMIFALIVSSIGIVTVGGLGSLQDARTNEQLENAKRAFDVLHDNMADVHAEGAPSRATEVSLGDSEVYFGDNVTVTVETNNGEAKYPDIRPVVFRIDGDKRLVYEAGATIQEQRHGGIVLNDPPFTIRDDNLGAGQVHVPIVRTTAPDVRSIGGTNVLIRGQSTTREVLNESVTAGKRLESIAIGSTPRYEIWAQYFRSQEYCDTVDETPGSDDLGTATCELGDYGKPKQLYVTHQEIRLSLID